MTTIRDILNNIINEELKNYEIYSKICKVISVNETERTCELEPVDGTADIEKARLQASINSTSGFVCVPSVDSFIIATFIINELAFVSVCTEVDKILIDTDLVQFNGGNNNGLIKIDDLVTKLNGLVTEVEALKTWANIHVHATAATGPPVVPTVLFTGNFTSFNKNNFEDTKIKH